MFIRHFFSIVLLIIVFFLISCSHISKRMPGELSQMHDFLTRDAPGRCYTFHYNFERQTPRLYHEQQMDSIFDAIEYIKTECGPTSNIEVTRLLLLADRGQFDDSLIGSATIPQMLWHRSEQEYLLRWKKWATLYGSSQSIDNTTDNFTKFRTELAQRISSNSNATPMGQTFGLFYSGAFDSAFNHIQSDELQGTVLRKNYDDYVNNIKHIFPSRGNIGILIGNWRPQGNNKLLGKHPDIGFQMGAEWKLWRVDAIISYRFLSAKNKYQVDSLSNIVATDEFDSWLFGIDGGVKFLDNSLFSTDLFIGIGYDAIYSLSKEGNPEEHIAHGSFAASFGLRQRVFLNRRTGWYIGGTARYSFVDYSNPRGTDLSGNTLTISIICGWSFHETLNQFLKKLNYKGNWRQQ
jgi:hypothetical protein